VPASTCGSRGRERATHCAKPACYTRRSATGLCLHPCPDCAASAPLGPHTFGQISQLTPHQLNPDSHDLTCPARSAWPAHAGAHAGSPALRQQAAGGCTGGIGSSTTTPASASSSSASSSCLPGVRAHRQETEEVLPLHAGNRVRPQVPREWQGFACVGVGVCVCVFVCVCVCLYVCAHACVCMRTCVCMHACVRAFCLHVMAGALELRPAGCAAGCREVGKRARASRNRRSSSSSKFPCPSACRVLTPAAPKAHLKCGTPLPCSCRSLAPTHPRAQPAPQTISVVAPSPPPRTPPQKLAWPLHKPHCKAVG